MQKELMDLIGKHKLNRIKHWQVIRICNEILNNDNQDVSIGKPNAFFEEGDEMPKPLDKMIGQLKKLCKDHEILFSQTSYQGDEGGSLYLCYLLKPKYKEEYWRNFDEQVMPNMEKQKDPGFFHGYQWLINHPDHFVQIWAGAY